MELQTWIYYVITILVLTATPGPNIFLALTTSISKSFKHSLYTVFGGLSATLIIMTLSFLGLGVVVASSQVLFDIIKYAGALYLIYLGYQALTSKQENYDIKDDGKSKNIDKKALFIKGFIVGSSNPKAIVFFVALFPQFIDINSSMLIQYIIFVGTFIVPELAWLIFYAYLGKKSSSWFLAKGRAKFFNRLTGGIFIGAGAILSTSSRT